MTDVFEGNEFDFIEGDALQEALDADRSRSDTPEMVAFRQFFDGLNSNFFAADALNGPSIGLQAKKPPMFLNPRCSSFWRNRT